VDLSFAPASVDVFHLSAKLKLPRQNAFGAMDRRPCLLVRMRDGAGNEGWGEGFANWPVFGAAHRKRILTELLIPAIIGREFDSPPALWHNLTDRFHAIAVQCNEPGPFEQCIAALDIAAWDLVAKRADVPLYAVLGKDRPAVTRPYASALTGATIGALVPPLLDRGWEGFKIKVGFGNASDIDAVERLRGMVGPSTVMLDANQQWDVAGTLTAARDLAGFDPLWLEEPLPADAPLTDWTALAKATPIPLAAGENVRGEDDFADILPSLAWVQPDAIKWGGLSCMANLAGNAHATGTGFAPHYLGGGIGLLATAHLARAMGAQWLEVDVSENPLREALAGDAVSFSEGAVKLVERPGLGARPRLDVLERFAV
jgi:L-alanine-DL-glutamate epimerase-like enolase superfamily enzyme